MKTNGRVQWKLLTCFFILAGSLLAAPAMAQEEEDAAADLEEIVVTGSRIVRDEYSSAAPLQTFDVEAARRSGITTVSELLQQSPISYGQQINGELNTNAGNSNASESPPLGGVGSANIALRGLDPERTLVLLNGRRLGSSGVRGAPAQPDVNLIPLTMVQRIEVITEGASSVYGADAVAGVVNVILRNDFEGFELNAYGNVPQEDGGEVGQFSFLMGGQGDDTRFLLGGEYMNRERVTTGSRVDCIRTIRQTQDGEIFSACNNGFPDNAAIDIGGLFGEGPFINPNGDIIAYFTPGSSDTGVPNFSSTQNLPPCEAPLTGGAAPGFTARNNCDPRWNDQAERLAADLVQGMERFSLVMSGGWQPGWFGDEEVYVEAMYLNRQTENRAATEQIFPAIPAEIPQEDANGNIIVDATGAPILVDNPMNPFPNSTAPLVTLGESLPQIRDVELQHFRIVSGIRGDFTRGWLADRNWTWDGYVSYDRGVGFVDQPVMNEISLILAVDTLRLDADGNPVCGIDRPGGVIGNDLGFVGTPLACVPINWFSPTLYSTDGTSTGGRFATQEEEDFLIANRLNRTAVTQTIGAAYVTGEIADIPTGGPVRMAFGLEYRADEIDSSVEYIGSRGLVTAENPQQEGDSVGKRHLKEAYAEVSLPIFTDKQFAELVEVEAALRYTEESNFGEETTGRFRASWRPNDWLGFSGSYGTSFRAPNLREQFLADQFAGVSGGADPCAVPPEADIGDVYQPQLDNRPQIVMDNCVASGADPTQLGLRAVTTIPVQIGGNALNLLPETSDTVTATVQFSPTINDTFGLDVAVSYYSIAIEDTIRSIDAETIMFRCYNDAPDLASPFCSRLGPRPGTNPSFNLISSVDASFVNIGEETSEGWDLNTRVTAGFDWAEVIWLSQATFSTEREVQIFEGETPDELKGTYGYPEVSYNSNLILNLSENWSVSWVARFIDETTADSVARSPQNADCDNFTVSEFLTTTEPTASVCDAASRWYNDLAATYLAETWQVTGGVKNVGDKQPPLISASAGSNRANRITSSGYEQFGRQFFVNFTKSF
jgi:iron complex outermembrane recepter protein